VNEIFFKMWKLGIIESIVDGDFNSLEFVKEFFVKIAFDFDKFRQIFCKTGRATNFWETTEQATIF